MAANCTAPTPSGPKSSAVAKAPPMANKNGPEHRFQLNHHLMYEREFGGDTYVSAHLQRLQHGCFNHKNIHNKELMHVTFAAITFTFHPSVSEEHRFKSAVICLTAKSATGQPIRILKFAPHLAFGRISSESLKWNFKLGATVGVSQGPAKAAIEPSIGEEKDRTVGTMMKIQGSTRSTRPADWDRLPNEYNNRTILPDTKMVWSLEENSQQGSGLPRELTFIVLMERLRSPRSLSTTSVATVRPTCATRSRTESETTVSTEATACNKWQDKNKDIAQTDSSLAQTFAETIKEDAPYKHLMHMFHHEDESHENAVKQLDGHGLDGVGSDTPGFPALDVRSLPHEILPGSSEMVFEEDVVFCRNDSRNIKPGNPDLRLEDIVASPTRTALNGREEEVAVFPDFHHSEIPASDLGDGSDGLAVDGAGGMLGGFENEMAVYKDDIDKNIKALCSDYKEIFTPIHFSISVSPQINGTLDKKLFSYYSNHTLIDGEFGQRFPTVQQNTETLAGEDPEVMINGLYNFAHLPGDWEDLVELPGNAVTSVEPTLN